MGESRCPMCGLPLIEDAWEVFEENDKDGSILLDSFSALVCPGECGYYVRLSGGTHED
ncbi:hypothetical protein [Falsibacillus pallidus]|uniref:Uncharacterized protein n=1 Tax=Falsibacillus pallidus TaxID=493781 RepID=A0A370G0E6_9BACI|nr:hypothetical protein [Falsibacillus pallidus]RDI36476.1 hypothetical protein DFR59_12911 [Falsibacillus pallidus]